ncbi:MAG: ADP-ribosylglycohydrolase family protein, partial [Acetomicrobium sp.]
VPEALIAFLESENFEDALKKAISLGGDADTQAAIAGAVAHAHYGGIPEEMTKKACSLLPQAFLDVIDAFVERYDVF